MTLYFYSHLEEPYGGFSNFSAHGFSLDGRYWKTSEHFFQAQKFVGTEHFDVIARAPRPHDAARWGREKTRPLRKDWESVKDDLMRRAVWAKFTAHPELAALLLSTHEEPLVENTSGDYYWGCGTNGTGKNMLGKILVETRARLRREGAPAAR